MLKFPPTVDIIPVNMNSLLTRMHLNVQEIINRIIVAYIKLGEKIGLVRSIAYHLQLSTLFPVGKLVLKRVENSSK